MAIPLRFSTASQEIPIGQALDTTDGDTPESSLTISNTDIKLHKAGATTLANKNLGGATYISDGVYYMTLDATDTNTYGSLTIFVNVANALAMKVDCWVMNAAIYDAFFGTSDLSVNISKWLGTAAATPTVAGVPEVDLTHVSGVAEDVPSNTELNARTLPSATYFDPTTDAVANVTVVGSVTGSVGSVTGAVGSVTGNVGGVAGTINTLDGLDAAQDIQHSTTQTHLTDIKGGTFSGVTDSLEAVRDRGDAAWTTATSVLVADKSGFSLAADQSAVTVGAANALGAQAKVDVNAEIVDALSIDTYAEPGQGAPAAATSLAAKINYLFKSWRNKSTQTATGYSLFNDAGVTVDQKATVSDDTTTATKGEIVSGP